MHAVIRRVIVVVAMGTICACLTTACTTDGTTPPSTKNDSAPIWRYYGGPKSPMYPAPREAN